MQRDADKRHTGRSATMIECHARSNTRFYFVCLLSWIAPGTARAQQREPFCRTVETRRLSAHSAPAQNLAEPVLARPLLSPSRGAARFIVVWREGRTSNNGGSVARYLRIDETMARVGERGQLTVGEGRTFVPMAIAALAEGTLVLGAADESAWAIMIPADGAAPLARTLFTAPQEESASAPRNRVTWATAIERGDGAVALFGLLDGAVRAYRFDRTGNHRNAGSEATWSQRVGGSMHLLPTGANGPVAALLRRPLPGVGPSGEEPAVQMLVTLDERLLPVGVPERTGFAQFPFSAVSRGSSVEIAQWFQSNGVAIGRFAVSARRVALDNPRLWYAQPPFAGIAEYAAGLAAEGGVSYALTINTYGGSRPESHLAWIPPSGEPMLRRNVVPVFGTVLGSPAMLPAEDGFVTLVAHNDEAGFALDAHHVRCELVRRE
jgi:hypothetical protein